MVSRCSPDCVQALHIMPQAGGERAVELERELVADVREPRAIHRVEDLLQRRFRDKLELQRLDGAFPDVAAPVRAHPGRAPDADRCYVIVAHVDDRPAFPARRPL